MLYNTTIFNGKSDIPIVWGPEIWSRVSCDASKPLNLHSVSPNLISCKPLAASLWEYLEMFR